MEASYIGISSDKIQRHQQSEFCVQPLWKHTPELIGDDCIDSDKNINNGFKVCHDSDVLAEYDGEGEDEVGNKVQLKEVAAVNIFTKLKSFDPLLVCRIILLL
eukprot:gene1284-2479_t